MRGTVLTIAALYLGLTACTGSLLRSFHTRSESAPLTSGDEHLVAGDYQAAIDRYDTFLRTNPADPEASRVRATRAILDRLLREEAMRRGLEHTISIREAELARGWSELAALRARVTSQESELDRLRLSSFQIWRAQQIREDELHRLLAALAEAKRAKKDLELLKTLDLQAEQRVR